MCRLLCTCYLSCLWILLECLKSLNIIIIKFILMSLINFDLQKFQPYCQGSYPMLWQCTCHLHIIYCWLDRLLMFSYFLLFFRNTLNCSTWIIFISQLLALIYNLINCGIILSAKPIHQNTNRPNLTPRMILHLKDQNLFYNQYLVFNKSLVMAVHVS